MWIKTLACLISLLYGETALYASDQEEPYLIGRSRSDVTGPAAEVGMMGYAQITQKSRGIHNRQWARAYIVVDRKTQKRVVFVSIDQGCIFHSVVQGVVAKLQQKFKGLYNEKNIVLSATHTHSAAGGHSHYALYNITILGFITHTYEVLVSGISDAISKAHADLKPGRIYYNSGQLHNASVNRSLEAFNRNPEEEIKSTLPSTIDPTVSVLKLTRNDIPIGVISWFAVHPVSMTSENRLLSSDNKGYASYLWETLASDENLATPFVAAFAQTTAGDMSPNLNLDGTGPGKNQFENTEIIGRRQFNRAREIFAEATTELEGPVDFRHRIVDLSDVKVKSKFTGGLGPQKTCTAALGVGFAAGTEDGRGPSSIFTEGTTRWNPFYQSMVNILNNPDPEMERCHQPKPILLAVGKAKPHPWVNERIPFSIIRIGQLSIAAIPGEMTVMAGNRLKKALESKLNGIVVIAGLSNAYTNYVTTFEEYQAQHYEGASTLFGPFTLAAYIQEFTNLARHLNDKTPLPIDQIKPRNLKDEQLNFQPSVVKDGTPRGIKFGDVAVPPEPVYRAGEKAICKFWTGHPRNSLLRHNSFLEIQIWLETEKKWQTVATDNDWSTFYRWQRYGWTLATSSQAAIEWQIPASQISGKYRILHHGHAKKSAFSRKVTAFQGVSPSFLVQGQP